MFLPPAFVNSPVAVNGLYSLLFTLCMAAKKQHIPLIMIKEACLYLGVHQCTIYDYINNPERPLPFIRIYTDKGASSSREVTSLPTRKRVFQEESASSRTALVNRRLPLDLPGSGTQFHWLQGRPAKTDLPSASASWHPRRTQSPSPGY